jgi:hypothetical protein
MEISQVQLIADCLKVLCDASTELLLQCNATDLEKARNNLQSIKAPRLIAAEATVESNTPSTDRETNVATSTSALLEPPKLISNNEPATCANPGPGPEGRVPNGSTSTFDPKQDGSVPSPIVGDKAQTLFRVLNTQKELVQVLVQQSPSEALERSDATQKNPDLDYQRLTDGLPHENYRGHHAIVQRYADFEKTGGTVKNYVESERLSSKDSARLLKMLRDGKKLKSINAEFKAKFLTRFNSQEHQLEVEQDVEGALVPWLTFCHRTWSRIPHDLISRFVDLCVADQAITVTAFEYSEFYTRSKNLYESNNASAVIPASERRGQKRQHSAQHQEGRKAHRISLSIQKQGEYDSSGRNLTSNSDDCDSSRSASSSGMSQAIDIDLAALDQAVHQATSDYTTTNPDIAALTHDVLANLEIAALDQADLDMTAALDHFAVANLDMAALDHFRLTNLDMAALDPFALTNLDMAALDGSAYANFQYASAGSSDMPAAQVWG